MQGTMTDTLFNGAKIKKDLLLDLDVSNQYGPTARKANGTGNNGVNGNGGAKIGRKRSNSKSQSQPQPVPTHNLANNSVGSATSSANSITTANVVATDKRMNFNYVLVLTTLNETFDKKTLVIPYYPDSLKLGRPSGTKVSPKPDNGYFDSRVLSRNHASIFANPDNGKVYIKDLGSSNGTFVNGNKISTDKNQTPVELKIGDHIDLGFNIEMTQNHKRISASVDDITIIPLNNTGNLASAASALQKNELTFDTALFGDINPDFEDFLLGFNNEVMSGIFNNSNISNSSQLEISIKTVIDDLQNCKKNNLKLKTIENFIMNYQKNQAKLNESIESKHSRAYEKLREKLSSELDEEKSNWMRKQEHRHEELLKKLSGFEEREMNFKVEIARLNIDFKKLMTDNDDKLAKINNLNSHIEKLGLENDNLYKELLEQKTMSAKKEETILYTEGAKKGQDKEVTDVEPEIEREDVNDYEKRGSDDIVETVSTPIFDEGDLDYEGKTDTISTSSLTTGSMAAGLISNSKILTELSALRLENHELQGVITNQQQEIDKLKELIDSFKELSSGSTSVSTTQKEKTGAIQEKMNISENFEEAGSSSTLNNNAKYQNKTYFLGAFAFLMFGIVIGNSYHVGYIEDLR